MKRLYLRILVAFTALAGFAIAAKAQVIDQVVATIPFEFVVNGKTLPPGTYTVKRVSNDRSAGLVLSSFENRQSAVVLPMEVEYAPTDKPQLTFETAGDEHFLSQIRTADNVYNIPVSREAILLAQGKSNTGSAPQGTSSGSN